MIAMLTGTLAYKSPEFIIVDVHGVGYRVQIPFSTYFELSEEGTTTTLHIFTHVKEDAISLYGFRTITEKTMFQHLISVSGIGPKLATNILSNSDVTDLAASITGGNLTRLSGIPGIGRKTAERLVLELRDKLQAIDQETKEATAKPAKVTAELLDDVTSALVNLGYKEAQVRKVIGDISLQPNDTVETVLKQSLKLLMK